MVESHRARRPATRRNFMSRFDSPLDNVRVAAPCSADWEQMIGNERARFCAQCNLNVYNLSSMTKSEAESFIARNEGSVCVRFYRRRDGSIIADNCPVGLRAIRRRMSYIARAVASAVLSFFTGLGVYKVLSSPPVLRGVVSQGQLRVLPLTPPPVSSEVTEDPQPAEMGEMMIGKVRLASGEDGSRRKKAPRFRRDEK